MLQASRGATLSFSEIVVGSISYSDTHFTSPTGSSSASSTRSVAAAETALANAVACSASSAPASGPSSTVAAKPITPSWTTRRPIPSSVSSAVVSTRPSRSTTAWERIRSMRTSALLQPSHEARSSAAEHVDSRGKLRNSGRAPSPDLLLAPVVIVESDDVLLLERLAVLDLDQHKIDGSIRCDPVGRADGHVDARTWAYRVVVSVDRHDSGTAHDEPMFRSVCVDLVAQAAAGRDGESFDLVIGCLAQDAEFSPGTFFGDDTHVPIMVAHQPSGGLLRQLARIRRSDRRNCRA